MSLFMIILLIGLIICALAVTFTKNLLKSVLVFMGFSLIMSVIWILLESPDLAITEAAVGAGVTTVLFLATLKKIHGMEKDAMDEDAACEQDSYDKEGEGEKES